MMVKSPDYKEPEEVKARVSESQKEFNRSVDYYESAVHQHLKSLGIKITKTNLKKYSKGSALSSLKSEIRHEDHPIGAVDMAIHRMIEDNKTVDDYKRELAQLEKESNAKYDAARSEQAPGHAMGRKSDRDKALSWLQQRKTFLKDKIQSMGGSV